MLKASTLAWGGSSPSPATPPGLALATTGGNIGYVVNALLPPTQLRLSGGLFRWADLTAFGEAHP